MENVEELGSQNAINYIKDKYGISAEIENIEICKDREEGNSFPPPNGYVLLSMRYRDKSFTVQINGENETLEGIDDFQYELITADAKNILNLCLLMKFMIFIWNIKKI